MKLVYYQLFGYISVLINLHQSSDYNVYNSFLVRFYRIMNNFIILIMKNYFEPSIMFNPIIEISIIFKEDGKYTISSYTIKP